MKQYVSINPNCLTTVATIGHYEVKEPWFHIDRTQPIICMLFVLNGEVFVSEEAEDYHLQSGDVFFLKDNLRHYGKKTTPVGSRWLWVSFWPYIIDENLSMIQLPKQLQIKDFELFRDKIEALHKLYHQDIPYKSEKLQIMLHDTLLHTAEEAAYTSTTYCDSHLTLTIKDYLILNYNQPFSAMAIEKALNMNYSYLGRVFKKDTGMTINQYANEVKIRKATDWLYYCSYNITQISDYLGFINPYYFSRVFKKVTGLSPRDYQKQLYK